MDSRFPRITSDLMVNAGLPSIRDTGIAAFMIAAMRMGGKTISDIMHEFPILGIEDIEEAQAVQLDAIMWSFPSIAHKVRGLTASIENISAVYREVDDTSTITVIGATKEIGKAELSEMATQYSRRLYDYLQMLSNFYGNYSHDYNRQQTETFPLSTLIEHIQPKNVSDAITIADHMKAGDYDLIGNKWLITEGIRQIAAIQMGLERPSRIHFSLHEKRLRVTIERTDYSLSDNTFMKSIIRDRFDFLHPFSVGSALLVQSGLHPRISFTTSSMIYQFEIPISTPDENAHA